MDGASKFVRGDAIAGLLIMFINIIGGMIIGIAQQGMSLRRSRPHLHAAHRRRRPRHPDPGADRLDRRRPARLQGGVGGAADKALLRQLSGYPKALGMSAAVMVRDGAAARHSDAAVPGARRRRRRARLHDRQARHAKRPRRAPPPTARRRPPRRRRAEEPISTALKIDDLKIELGYALLPLVNAPDGSDRLTEQIKALRRSLATEMGFVMPAVRILDNVQLDANTYVIKIKEVEAGRGRVWPAQFMVMDPIGRAR